MAKKRIALVTVWFPPNNGVAVNRMSAFAKYLGDTYHVEVFTIGETTQSRESEFGKVHEVSIHSFWKKIKHQTSDSKLVHKFKTGANVICSKLGVSPFKQWKKLALKSLIRAHNDESFDVVISSFSPVEPHEVAEGFITKFPKVKWIADMRDEMSSNPFSPELEKKRLRELELRIQKHVTGITTVSAPILDDFKVVMPEVSLFEEVRNGFDHDYVPQKGFNEVFTFVYAGTFYGKRKPNLFFEALLQLRSEGKIGDDFKCEFIGANRNFNIPSELLAHIEFVEKIPYAEAIERMGAADCNVLINPPLGTKGQFSGKVFDYISVEKPILALVDMEDVAAELILEHNAGIPVDFYAVEEIKNAIVNLYGYWKRKEIFPIKREKTHLLHRKHQVDKLKTLIEKITE